MKLNGDVVDDFQGTVDEFLESHAIRRSGIAVAVDGEVIPRSLWRSRSVDGANEIEIVTAAAGG